MFVPAMVDREEMSVTIWIDNREGMSMTVWMDKEEEYDRDRRNGQRERHNCDH